MSSFKSYGKWLFLIAGFSAIFISLAFWNNSPDPLNLPKQVDFNFHIRPILSNNCYTCHGPDSSSREAGLRLDNFESATAILENGGAAIVPGNSKKSLIIQRTHAQDPNDIMPPPEAKKELSERELALLTRWIDQGAKWKDYWAFIPPQSPKLPRKIREKEPYKVIDYFIDKQLKYNQLTPSSKAKKSSLIRRVSYLLTGLPPTGEELVRFYSDTTDRAYERMIDYYLASPQYGERWARHWMDLVRYGETMGHEFDFPVSNAWEYRDYLIRAYNQDVPYDLFVKEHLAGDMLEHPRRNPEEGFNESIMGTGYFFLGEGKHSPVSTKQEESDKIDNMIDVTSKTFMGLTVSCARCHDHKFDPIPSTDYYAMYGMIESARLGPLPARRTLEQEQQFGQVVELKKDISQQIRQYIDEVSTSKSQMPEIIPARLETTPKNGLPKEPSMEDGRVLADFRSGNWAGWYVDGWAFGEAPIKNAPIIDDGEVKVEGTSFGFASSRYYGTGIPGALRGPNFIIEHDSMVVRARGQHGIVRLIVDNFQLIQNPLWGGLEAKVNDSSWQTYTFDLTLAQGSKAYLQFMSGAYGDKRSHQYRMGPEDYVEVAYAIAFDSTYTEPEFSKENSLAISPRLIQQLDLTESINTYDSLASQLYDSTHFIGMSEGEAVFSPIFLRGSISSLSEEKVERQFFHALQHLNDSFPQEGSGRLAWAEAVVDTQNPLGTRVYVNRLWHHIFGRGIVESVDNFGLQGTLPSHPELLDYLTLQFQEEGWSTKSLLKHILLSEAFQRSTQGLEINREKDPNNMYLHHFPIRRLESEAIRDGMLATAGCVDLTMYGPSVPIHLTDFLRGRGRPWDKGPLDGMGRRSIYMTIRRNFMDHFMSVFDQPTPFTTFGKRNITNVPAQSLTLMNDPFVKEQASFWANNLLAKEGLTREQRIQDIYASAFSRRATKEEVEKGKEFLDKQAAMLGCDFEEHPEDVQVWATYCHAMFNLKEFIHLL